VTQSAQRWIVARRAVIVPVTQQQDQHPITRAGRRLDEQDVAKQVGRAD
jgi:hypothetical protein